MAALSLVFSVVIVSLPELVALAVMLGLILCYGMMILVSVTVVLLLGTPG